MDGVDGVVLHGTCPVEQTRTIALQKSPPQLRSRWYQGICTDALQSRCGYSMSTRRTRGLTAPAILT